MKDVHLRLPEYGKESLDDYEIKNSDFRVCEEFNEIVRKSGRKESLQLESDKEFSEEDPSIKFQQDLYKRFNEVADSQMEIKRNLQKKALKGKIKKKNNKTS